LSPLDSFFTKKFPAGKDFPDFEANSHWHNFGNPEGRSENI
jgi:hypothetical protein